MIAIRNLSKVYNNGVKALDEVSFDIGKGELVSVIGRNGAGKSTLFKVITGIITDYEGSSEVFGQRSSIRLADQISYIPEVRGLDPRAYVLEHLTDLVRYKGFNRADAANRVSLWLDQFNMMKYRFQKISSLSNGNQQKLQLIVAVASDPKILILDEPFSGLDLITADYIWNVLLELQKKGCTIVFSTHDLNDNILNSNRFLFLREGRLVEEGTYVEIQDKYDMILQIRNPTLDVTNIVKITGNLEIEEKSGEFNIKISDESEAHRIFESLQEKYCDKFWVRKKTLPEIFREING